MSALLDEAKPPGAPSPRMPRLPRMPRRPGPRRPAASRPPAPRPVEGTPALVTASLAMVSLLCLWLVFQLLVLGGLSQARAQSLLYDDFRTQVASAIAPIGPVTPVGDPVATITMDRIGLDQVVVEGTSSGDTLAGPGHLRNTVLPGQVGTSVVIGRAHTYGGPFGRLGELVAGDTISVANAQGPVDFTVLGVRRAGDPLPQPLAAGAARLVLVTSDSDGGLSSFGNGEVLYVDADAAAGLPAPAGLPAAVPDSERPLGTDTAALPLLVLYLAVLLGLSLAVVAARQRWSGALVWVVATPVVLSVTWVTTDTFMRLLPNIL